MPATGEANGAAEAVRKVDSGTARDLMVLIYKVLEPEKITDYTGMHVAVKKVQAMLERDYSVTLGYAFNDGGKSSIHEVWDKELQNDIETYDALGKVVDNDERGFNVSSRPIGSYLLKTAIRYNLKQQFGDVDVLGDKISLAYLS